MQINSVNYFLILPCKGKMCVHLAAKQADKLLFSPIVRI